MCHSAVEVCFSFCFELLTDFVGLRLTEVSRQFRIDVLVITPPNETREDLERASKHYPKLRFEAAPCSPCEFDYLLDTNSSKIFVLDRFVKSLKINSLID